MTQNATPSDPEQRLESVKIRHATLAQAAAAMTEHVDDALADIYLSEDSHIDMTLERQLSHISEQLVEVGKLLDLASVRLGAEVPSSADLDMASLLIEQGERLLVAATPAAEPTDPADPA